MKGRIKSDNRVYFVFVALFFFGFLYRQLDRGSPVLLDAPSTIVEPPLPGFLFYFAYASDMLEDRVRVGSSKRAVFMGPASVEKYKVVFSIYSKVWKGGVADIIKDPKSKAWGVLYQIPIEDIPKLDKQKGIENLDPKYEKIQLDVKLDSKIFPTFSYSVVEFKRQLLRSGGYQVFKPTPQYKRCIVNGAIKSKLPESYIKRIQAIEDNKEAFKRKSLGNTCD